MEEETKVEVLGPFYYRSGKKNAFESFVEYKDDHLGSVPRDEVIPAELIAKLEEAQTLQEAMAIWAAFKG